MSIEYSPIFRMVSDAEFEVIDRAVMGCAFASQNELGRLCEERVYENDMVERLRARGMTDVHTQLPVVVSHRGFKKTYWLDLIVNGVLYELKAVAMLTSAHEAQGFNYSAMLGLDRFKLLNFGSTLVEGRLKLCPFARLDRRDVVIGRDRWKPITSKCKSFMQNAESCLRDWGGFLEASLYTEALMFFNGGEQALAQRLPVSRHHVQLGYHNVNLIEGDIAFEVTALEKPAAYENQLRRLMQLLPLRAWQWINIYHSNMTIVTLHK
jgi:GxxExxY protein